MSWAERMAKPCITCKKVNPPDDGYINEDDELTLGYVCGKCGQRYQFKTQLNKIKVPPLLGMSFKGDVNKGEKIR